MIDEWGPWRVAEVVLVRRSKETGREVAWFARDGVAAKVLDDLGVLEQAVNGIAAADRLGITMEDLA